MTVAVSVLGVGLFGPGLDGWDASRLVLSGDVPCRLDAPLELPVAHALPPAERRRVGLALKLAMACGFDAISHTRIQASELPAIFSSTGGDCDNCHQILTTLASSDRAVSPTRFHNSVHNMPAGYWSIATGCEHASTSLCAYDATFAAGLLEAATQVHAFGRPCLLVAYDTAYPPPLRHVRPVSHAVGASLVLGPPAHATAGDALLGLNLVEEVPDVMAGSALEQLRLGVPTGRGLPLLERLARRSPGRVVLSYLDDLQLAVDVQYVG